MRLLMLIGGMGGDRASGPDIRGWHIAAELAERHEVTAVVEHAPPRPPAGIRLVEWSRRAILREALAHDAVLANLVPPYLMAALARRRVIMIADVYDPVELEAATLEPGPAATRRAAHARAARRLQLAFADLLLCASDAQRRQLEGALERVVAEPSRRPPVLVVPFGVDPEPPKPESRPLRERFPAIGEGDPLVLWWGNVWRWFDSETTIRAFQLLLERQPRARLVVSAAAVEGRGLRELLGLERLRELASSAGLLDRSVFLLDEWIPYERRHEHLQDADVGLTLHRDAGEAALAARARYMDYLWARLPCVLSEGNETGDAFAAAGFAATVPIGDAEAACAALERLLSDAERERARAAAGPLLAEAGWGAAVAPLLEALERPPAGGRRPAGAAAVAAGRYYAGRALDLALRARSSSPWRRGSTSRFG